MYSKYLSKCWEHLKTIHCKCFKRNTDSAVTQFPLKYFQDAQKNIKTEYCK